MASYDDVCMSTYYYTTRWDRFSYLSEPANRFINLLPSDEKLISYQENLDHDGYDRYGPESDLWDLYLITKKGSDYIFYSLHWENWFRNDTHEYDLCECSYLKNFVWTNYLWPIIKKMSKKDRDLSRFVNSIYTPFYQKDIPYDFDNEIVACHTSDKFYIILTKKKYSYESEDMLYSVTFYNKSDKTKVETIPYSNFKKKYAKLRCNKWFRKTLKLARC